MDVRGLPGPIRRFGKRLLYRSGYDGVILLVQDALRGTGWIRSYRSGRPVTEDGRPLPWYTYGAIHFLEDRLRPTIRVFEYGAGHSTLWYATRTSRVVSVEHDAAWAESITDLAPPNASVILRSDPAAYLAEIYRHEPPFDLIAIDGIDRLRCVPAALRCLAPTGVLVWDNSDRQAFSAARAEIADLRAFGELRFTGFGPCGTVTWSTSILYRPANCLEI